MDDTSPIDNAFRYTVEGDLKYSPRFWFWWHWCELRARLRAVRKIVLRRFT